MKKILLLLLTLIIISGCTPTSQNQEQIKQETNSPDIYEQSKTSLDKVDLNETLINIIKTNDDAYKYLYDNPNYKIISIETFLPSQKLNNTDFPNEYKNLEERKYYEIKIKGDTDLTLITIVDLENNITTSAFGIFLIEISS